MGFFLMSSAAMVMSPEPITKLPSAFFCPPDSRGVSCLALATLERFLAAEAACSMRLARAARMSALELPFFSIDRRRLLPLLWPIFTPKLARSCNDLSIVLRSIFSSSEYGVSGINWCERCRAKSQHFVLQETHDDSIKEYENCRNPAFGSR